MSASTCPAWCGGCEQLSDAAGGVTVHRGMGYSVPVDQGRGEVVPLIVDGDPVVAVSVPTESYLTPGEARRFAHALTVIAGMVEDARGGAA